MAEQTGATAWRGLRSRLLMIVLFSVIPLMMLLIVYAAVQNGADRENALTAAEARLDADAQSIRDMTEQAEATLVTYGITYAIQAQRWDLVQGNSDRLAQEQPDYAVVAVTDASGVVRASSVPTATDVDLSDSRLFTEAVQSARVAVSGYELDALTGKPALQVSYPVYDSADRLIAVTYIGLDLERVQERLSAGTGRHVVEFVADDRGVVLARTPSSKGYVGENFSHTELVRTMIGGQAGRIETTSLDNKERTHVFRPVFEEGWGHLFLTVGFDTDAYFAPQRRTLLLTLVGFLGVGLAALIVAWVFGTYAVYRPALMLRDATARLAAGDLTARADMPDVGDEFSELGSQFNDMAEAVDVAVTELRESLDRLAAFAVLTDFPFRDLTVKQVLDTLLRRISDNLGADGAAVLLLEGSNLIPAGAVGPGAESTSIVVWGEDVAGEAAAANRPVTRCTSPEGDEAPGELADGCGVRSVIGVPMHYDAEVVGVLRVDWCDCHEPTEAEISLLEMSADRCAIAVENVRLYSREHRVAETLQLALMSVPDDLCGVRIGQFYCSATEDTLVGGDFFDVFEVAQGHVGIAVGDVSGKGLKAAAVTAQVRNALRAHAIDGDDPAVVMTKVNTLLERFTGPETFVTAFYAVLDIATGGLHYAGAGHLPPLVAGKDGVRELRESGAVLGAFEGATYETAYTELSERETLVLFTDGLTEARDPWGTFFGETRVSEMLAGCEGAPADVAAHIKHEVLSFSGGRLRDDVAVLVLQRTPGECPGAGALLGC